MLLAAGANRHPTVVVDMTSTQFRDFSGLGVPVRVPKRALTGGGELRLFIPGRGR